MADKNLGAAIDERPMTEGDRELQAVREAAKEIAIAIATLQRIIRDFQHNRSTRLPEDFEGDLPWNLDKVSGIMQRFQDDFKALWSELKIWNIQLHTIKEYKKHTAEKRTEERKRPISRENGLREDAEAFPVTKNIAAEKMREALPIKRVVEAKENKLAVSERRPVNLEEEQALKEMNVGANGSKKDGSEGNVAVTSGDSDPSTTRDTAAAENELVAGGESTDEVSEKLRALEDLNLGADAVLQDKAEAAAVESMQSARLTSPGKRPTSELEESSDAHPPSGVFLTERYTRFRVRIDRLGDRDDVLTSQEGRLNGPEHHVTLPEQLLEQKETAKVQRVKRCKAQAETMLEELEGRVCTDMEETQAMIGRVIEEAGGLLGQDVGNEDQGEDRGDQESEPWSW